MKRFISCILIVLSTVAILAACSKNSGDAANQSPSASNLTGTHFVEITIKDYGLISVELDADAAPITVSNFVHLAEKGFYDGLTFHRIINGFMMQGGASNNAVADTIKGEFELNGVRNEIKHTRGTISMARTQEMDSASSQFFIMHADTPYLDGQYAAFGHVTSGIEIVDEICENTPVQDANGTTLEEDQPIIESIKIVKK